MYVPDFVTILIELTAAKSLTEGGLRLLLVHSNLASISTRPIDST